MNWVKHGVANSYLHKQTIQILRFCDFSTQGILQGFRTTNTVRKTIKNYGHYAMHVYAIHDSVSSAQILVSEVSFSTM